MDTSPGPERPEPAQAGPAQPEPARPWSPAAGAVARLLVALRWPLLLGWPVLAVALLLRFGPLTTGGGGLGDITSADNPALVAEEQDARAFGFPLLTRTLLVQHDPAGLPDDARRAAVDHAVALAKDGGKGPVQAALPVLEPFSGNGSGSTGPAQELRLPAVRQPGTTALTYLYPAPGLGFDEATRAAGQYAAGFDRAADRVVGVTGTVPARAEQVRLVNGSLRLLELVSLAAVLLIVAVAFRSLVAPLLTLLTAGVSFVLVTRLAGVLAERQGITVPADLEPLMVALMLGVTTDYVVYYLSGMRAELAEGRPRLVAARRTTAVFGPIVLVAGVTVAAGVATLLVARSPAIRAFGPAMALSVVMALLVAVTLVPALMAVLGRWAFWPARPEGDRRAASGGAVRRGLVRLVRHRAGAVVVAGLCLAGLAVAAAPARDLRAGLPFVAALPGDSEPARAARAAADGFVPGVVAPTLVHLQGAGLAGPQQRDALGRLEDLLARQPHVAGVLGPREDAALSALAGRDAGVFLRPDGAAARLLLVLDVDPLDATAVRAVDRLTERLPDLARQAGLTIGAAGAGGQGALAAAPSVAGDTAAVAEVIDRTRRDLLAVLVVALLVNLLVLVVFLRALVAPLFLLGCTVLSAAATLGLTALVFQDRLGHPGVTFFVPLAAGVLLVALGSDYNLFAVGHVFAEARRRPLREAMLAALPRSSGAITTAGVALAASLGTLALVPLRQFHELAFALVVGILIDALVVRTLLAPALLSLFGRFSGWPGRRLAAAPGPAAAARPAPSPAPPVRTQPPG